MSKSLRRFAAPFIVAGAVVLGVSTVEAGAATTAQVQVTPGAFCKGSETGRIDRTVTGIEMICSTAAGDSRAHWREHVPK